MATIDLANAIVVRNKAESDLNDLLSRGRIGHAGYGAVDGAKKGFELGRQSGNPTNIPKATIGGGLLGALRNYLRYQKDIEAARTALADAQKAVDAASQAIKDYMFGPADDNGNGGDNDNGENRINRKNGNGFR